MAGEHGPTRADAHPGEPVGVPPEVPPPPEAPAPPAGPAPAAAPGDGRPARAELDADAWASLLAPRLARFAAVARLQHMTRAARQLGVPQSTLSRSLARLEAELGVTLFARQGRALRLTRAGLTFQGAVERALAEVERAAESVRADADPDAGRIAFGFLHALGHETVPALLSAFRAEHPRVRFQLAQTYSDELLARLRSGALDLCLISPLPEEPGVVVRRLDEQRLRLVVPAGHRLSGRRRVRLAEFAADPFVTLEPGYGLRRITDALCAEAGFTPKVAFEGEEAETLRGLVAVGLGVALLPPPPAPRPGVVELDLTGRRAVREIGVAWLDGRRDTPPVAAFKSFLLSRKGRLMPH